MRSVRLLLLTLGTCQCATFQEPSTPDLSALDALYEHPPGGIAAIDLESVMNEAAESYALLQQYGNFDFMVQTLKQAVDHVKEAANPEDDSPFKLSAKGRVLAPCTAQGQAAPGTLEFEMVVDRNYLEPGISGEFKQCFTDEGDASHTIDGVVELFLGEATPLQDVDLSRVLVRFDGTAVASGSAPFEGLLHFRVTDLSTVEFGILGDTDMVVVGLLPQGGAQLRTREGSFCCDFERRQCLALAGDSCEEIVAGDDVWSW